MTAWSDFIGEGAQGLEGGRTSLFPRSLPLYDYQRTLWIGGLGAAAVAEVSGAKVKGEGDEEVGAKVKVVGDGVVKRESGQVVSDKGNFDIKDLSGKSLSVICCAIILLA